MEHPKLDDIYYAIANWAKQNLRKASLLYEKRDYEFTRVYDIRKVWIENNLWIVDATLNYKLDKKSTSLTMTFQIDEDLKIVGFDFHAPRVVPA